MVGVKVGVRVGVRVAVCETAGNVKVADRPGVMEALSVPVGVAVPAFVEFPELHSSTIPKQ